MNNYLNVSRNSVGTVNEQPQDQNPSKILLFLQDHMAQFRVDLNLIVPRFLGES